MHSFPDGMLVMKGFLRRCPHDRMSHTTLDINPRSRPKLTYSGGLGFFRSTISQNRRASVAWIARPMQKHLESPDAKGGQKWQPKLVCQRHRV